MKHIILLIGSLFFSFTFIAQCNFVLINSNTSNYTVNDASLVPCLNKTTYTVNLENVSPFTLSNLEVKIDLPTGVNYIVGSSVSATEVNTTDLNSPIFSLVNIGASTTNSNILSFSIDLDATCELQVFLNAGGIIENQVSITADATNNGSTVTCSITHTGEPYSASVPNLSITNVSEQSHIGSVGENFQRCISILNGGSGGLSKFILKDIHGAGISVSGITSGTQTTTGLTEEILLTGVDFSTIGNNDNIFDPGETIIICETINVLSCTGTSSTFNYSWGCNNENCQELTDGANVVFPGEIPNVKMQRYNSFRANGSDYNAALTTTDTLCFTEDGQYQSGITITNSGTGVAYNVLAQMESRNASSSSGFDVSNIRMTRNGVSIPFNRDSLINPTRYGSTWSSCLPAESVGNIDFLIDSIAPGDTVYVEWDWYTCFQHKNCTNRQHMMLWYYKSNYENKCAQNYEVQRDGGGYWIYFNHNFALDVVPGTFVGSSAATISYVSTSWYNYIPRNEANDLIRFQLIIPSCINYDINSFKITRTNGVVYVPDSSVISGDTINIFYSNMPVPNGGSFNESTIDYDISLDCPGSCGGGLFPIELTSFYTPNIKAGCDNELKLGCNSFNVNLVCPDPCEGIQFNQHYAKRINLGLPDNNDDGLPDATGTLDFARIRQDRLTFRDTLEILYGGNVINSLNDSIWPYVFVESDITGGRYLDYTKSELRIYESATGISYTANNITNPSLDPSVVTTVNDSKFDYSLDLTTLVFDTPLPAGYSLKDGDSVFFKAHYVLAINVVNAIVEGSSVSRMYCSDVAVNPPVSNQFGCPTLIKSFVFMGFHNYNWSRYDYNTKSCDEIRLQQNIALYMAGTYNALNKFRYEYRPFSNPETFKVTVPDDYTFNRAMFSFRRTAGLNAYSYTTGMNGSGVTNSHGYGAGNWPLEPISVVGNVYTFDAGEYFGDDPVNDSILYGDESYYGSFNIYLTPNCKVDGDISKRVLYEWEFETVPEWEGTTNNAATATGTSNYYWDDSIVGGASISDYHSDYLAYDKPKLLLQSNLVSQNVPSNTAEWNVSVTNNSNTSNASNTWFGMPTIGTVIADSILDVSTSTILYPSASGIFELGVLNAAQTLDYTIYTHITGCNSDSIELYHGWDCVGYPIDIASFPCTPLKTTFFMTPLMPELSNLITITSNDTIGLCDTASFEIEVRDFQLGNAFNLETIINVPTGMIIEPGSCFIRYPDAGTFVPITNPVNTSGNNWKWDVSSIEPTINSDGLSGVLDQTLNRYFIRFNCLTNCDFVSGSRITSVTNGEAKCGRSFNSNVEVSNQIFIGDALPPYAASLKINTTYITPCLSNTPIELVVVNNGPLSFGTNDSVYFRLDNGISYDVNSYTGLLNAPTNGTPSIVNNNGVQELAWKLPAGVGVGDTTKFSFTINGDPSGLECGVLQLASQITTYGGAVCSTTGAFCDIDIATADTIKNIFIYKGYLDVSNSSASYSTSNAPSGETGNISFEIFNSGETISSGTETVIQYYSDVDNNGVYSVGDTYITNDTIQDQLIANSSYNYSGTVNIPGGLGCKLIAVIDTSLNPCTCTPSQILINLPLVLPSASHIICSEELIQVGNDPIDSHTYLWSPSTGLNDATLAQPIFNSTVAYPNTSSVELIRRIDRGGCFVNDTVNVEIISKPFAVVGPEINVCDNTVALTGNQPLGSNSGFWSIDSSHTQPGPVVFLDDTLFNTSINNLLEGTYQLVWTVSNINCDPTSDTIVINKFDTPIANAGPDFSYCIVDGADSTALSGLPAVGLSKGIWTELSGAGLQTGATIVVDSVENTYIKDLVEGTYQFLWTVSNFSCSDSIDTVEVKVYAEPIANAGPDFNYCIVAGADSVDLSGLPAIGLSKGVWTELSGGGLETGSTIVNDSLENTYIKDLVEGTYQFLWTVSNSSCSDSIDTVEVKVSAEPIANAGPDFSYCIVSGADSVSLSGLPAIGFAKGTWTEVNGGGLQTGATIVADSLENTYIKDLVEGTYQFVWTVTNSNCSDSIDTVEVKVFAEPIANAGPDFRYCIVAGADSISLSGQPAIGLSNGIWTELSSAGLQTGSTIVDNNIDTTFVKDLVEGTYQFVWTVSNSSCSDSIDTVEVKIYAEPIANAGPDFSYCIVAGADSVDLSGLPAIGLSKGVWTEVNRIGLQTGSTIVADTVENTFVKDLVEGTYQFVWKVSNSSCSDSIDTVEVKVYAEPIANAGPDFSYCIVAGADSVDLSGLPAIGLSKGIWTEVNGVGLQIGATIVTDTVETTYIKDLVEGTYQFVWTVTNSNCLDSIDTVEVKVYAEPIANAGPDFSYCIVDGADSIDLSGLPAMGLSKGIWTEVSVGGVQSGATIVADSLETSYVKDLVEGIYQFVWTVSNSSCSDSIDTVEVKVFAEPIANAGPDFSYCIVAGADSVDLSGLPAIGLSKGIWTEVNGAGLQTGAIIVTDTVENTYIKDLVEGTYQFVWTVTNSNCLDSMDTVEVKVFAEPISNAGPDFSYCIVAGADSVDLSGLPAVGLSKGVWTEVSGGGLQTGATIVADSVETTYIKDLVEGTYQFVWTVSNSSCSDSIDTVEVKVFAEPIANTGPDFSYCIVAGADSVDLSGLPAIGLSKGIWTEVNGAGLQIGATIVADSVETTYIKDLVEGTYQFVWTVSNSSCSDSIDTVEVKVFAEPIADAGPDFSYCIVSGADSVDLSGLPAIGLSKGIWTELNGAGLQTGATIVADTAENTYIKDLVEGTYQFVWTVSNSSCSDSIDTVEVRVYAEPIANAGPDFSYCIIAGADSVNLSGLPAIGLSKGIWTELSGAGLQTGASIVADSVENTFVKDLTEGIYQFKWTVSNSSCLDSVDIVELKVYSEVIANAGSDQVICEEFSAVLEGNEPLGTASGVWAIDNNFGNPTQVLFYSDIDYNATATNFQEGTYQLTWTLSNGVCPESIDTVKLSNYKFPTANFNIGDRVCYEECLDASNMSYVQSPYTIEGYSWILNGLKLEETSNFESQFCFSDTGAYELSLVVRTDKGCVDTSDVQSSITVMPLPIADFDFEPAIEITELLEVKFTDLSTNAVSVHYDFGDGMASDTLNPVYWYTTSGDYEVSQIVVNIHGCIDTIIKPLTVTRNDNLFIPNSFTPNGDGKNDVFLPVERGLEAKDYDLFIFDRWGKLIFESHDPEEGWDGTHKGNVVKIGAYIWKMNYFSIESQENVQKIGHVTVIN